MLPSHINPSESDHTAHAPYNFVPLNDQAVLVDPAALPDQDSYHPNRYTGQITCTLMTETPLFVRAPLELDEYVHYDPVEDSKLSYQERMKNKADFFYSDATNRQGSLRIPGSSLRGMLRSLVEILSYAKFEKVTNRSLVYRAIGDPTSHGAHYRDAILETDEQGYDAQNQRYWAFTPRVEAGYLVKERGAWVIYRAQRINGTTFARISHEQLEEVRLRGSLTKIPGCKNAEFIYIQPGPLEYQRIRGGLIRMRVARVLEADRRPAPGLLPEPCALAESGKIDSKLSEAVVFPFDPQSERFVVDDDLVAMYRNQVSQEQANLLGGIDGVLTEQEADGEMARDGFPRHRQPVFFLLDEADRTKLLFFGHTMMMRLPYAHSPKEMVPPALRQPKTVDVAEALFGYINDGDMNEGRAPRSAAERKATAYASRIAVGDARLVAGQGEIWLDEQPFAPRIMSTPKPNAFQHYLVQPQPDLIEVGRTRDNRSKFEKRLADYDAKPGVESTLRGYKHYWHKAGVVDRATVAEPQRELERKLSSRPDRAARDSQYTLIKPVKAGVQFYFTIRFENLAPWELGALLWAVTLPGGERVEYRHKLGMGKALGMGTVQLAPSLHLEDRRARYSRLFAPAGEGEMNWATGATTPSEGPGEGLDERPDEKIVAELIGKFESFLLPQIGEKEIQRLSDAPRIRALLKLLEWPGPTPESFNSEYMPLEAFRQRKVLPAPLATGRAAAPAHETMRAIFSTERPARAPRESQIAQQLAARLGVEAQSPATPATTSPARNPAEAVTRVTSRGEIKPGLLLEATVARVEVNRIVVELLIESAKGDAPSVPATLVFAEVQPKVRDRADAIERFAPNTPLRLWVKGINSSGNIQTSMRAPRK